MVVSMQLMEPFIVKHDVADNGGVRHCMTQIERRLDKTKVTVHGFNYGDRKYHVPSAVMVYYPNGNAETWHDEGYKRLLDADLVQEIDTQTALMYLMLA